MLSPNGNISKLGGLGGVKRGIESGTSIPGAIMGCDPQAKNATIHIKKKMITSSFFPTLSFLLNNLDKQRENNIARNIDKNN